MISRSHPPLVLPSSEMAIQTGGQSDTLQFGNGELASISVQGSRFVNVQSRPAHTGYRPVPRIGSDLVIPRVMFDMRDSRFGRLNSSAVFSSLVPAWLGGWDVQLESSVSSHILPSYLGLDSEFDFVRTHVDGNSISALSMESRNGTVVALLRRSRSSDSNGFPRVVLSPWCFGTDGSLCIAIVSG